MPKRTTSANAAKLAEAKRGGPGRGQGRKTNKATPAAKPAGPDPTDRRTQQSLGQLLGARAPAEMRATVPAADVIKWPAGEDGEQQQKQVKGGAVRYELEEDNEFILVQRVPEGVVSAGAYGPAGGGCVGTRYGNPPYQKLK